MVDQGTQLDAIVASLSKRFSDIETATIAGLVEEVAQTFRDARIGTFVPVLVRREAQERLQRL